jgi:hypothetical protein
VVANGEQVRGQLGDLDNFLGAHILNFGLSSFRSLRVVGGPRRMCDDTWNMFSVEAKRDA